MIFNTVSQKQIDEINSNLSDLRNYTDVQSIDVNMSESATPLTNVTRTFAELVNAKEVWLEFANHLVMHFENMGIDTQMQNYVFSIFGSTTSDKSYDNHYDVTFTFSTGTIVFRTVIKGSNISASIVKAYYR